MKRKALIIGNSEYVNFRKIKSCINDANAMESDFNTLLFNHVVCYRNLTGANIEKAIDDFSNNYECDSLNVIYFSGHGNNINGQDYIIGTNATLDEPHKNSVSIQRILNKYSGMKSYLLIIIDACRVFEGTSNNNFNGISMQKDVMIAYSTQIGKEAFGAGGKNLSPFTEAIHNNILKANLTMSNLFQLVRGQLNNDKYVQMSCEISTMTVDMPLTYEFVDKTDINIREFIMDVRNGTCLEAAIKATKLFDRGYLDVMYSFHKVGNKQLFEWKCPMYFTEAECKSMEFRQLTEMSNVIKQNHRFYYKNEEIRIGEVPLLPSSLAYQEPITPLSVKLKISAKRDNGKIEIKVCTNLPKGFVLIVSFPNSKIRGSQFLKIDGIDTVVKYDENEICVKDNEFLMQLSSVSISENSELIPVVGKNGRNLMGKYIEFSNLFGNQVQFFQTILIQ